MGLVNVTISGKIYRMACDDGQEEHLEALGHELGETIELLRSQFGEIGDQRLTVMAAITLADRFSESEKRAGQLEGELAEIEKSRSQAKRETAAREAELAEALDTVAGRIEMLADRLNGGDAPEAH